MSEPNPADDPPSDDKTECFPPVDELVRVEVVIGAWRAENLAVLIEAFRRQTVRCLITVVSSGSQAEGGAFPEALLALADRVYRTGVEFGAFNRYVPAFAYEGEFLYFHDDDMLPGSRLIEHFVEQARLIGDFGVLGQNGRIFHEGKYASRGEKRLSCPRRVDMLVRGYFLRNALLFSVLESLRMLNLVPSRDNVEDDLVLAWSMARKGRLCYLTAADADPETRMDLAGLSETAARCRRSSHFKMRECFVEKHWKADWLCTGSGLRTNQPKKARQG